VTTLEQAAVIAVGRAMANVLPHCRLLVLASLLVATGAVAQPAAPTPEVHYQRRTVHDFSTLNIDGRRSRPDSGNIHTRKTATFRSMIRMRGHFRAEMLESANQL
jgi:hypothetical protein